MMTHRPLTTQIISASSMHSERLRFSENGRGFTILYLDKVQTTVLSQTFKLISRRSDDVRVSCYPKM